MRLTLFFFLISFSIQAQLPTRLRLKQLELGPANSTLKTDSTGLVVFDTLPSGDGNGIYDGSGTVPSATKITTTANNSGYDLAIGKFPVWPNADPYDNNTIGLSIAENWDASLSLSYQTSILQMRDQLIDIYTSSGSNSSELELTTGSNGYLLKHFSATGTGRVNSRIRSSTTAGIDFGTFTSQSSLLSGTGSPEGVVTGNPGDMYVNRAGGVGATFYIKESGSNTNTGWVAK